MSSHKITTTNKTLIIIASSIIALVAMGILLVTHDYQIQFVPKSVLSEVEARTIAERYCIKGGEALAKGSYNKSTKTWWFDANLNTVQEGCDPACVVDEESRTADVNWRCAGLTTPTPDPIWCGIENCHGLDIACGPKPAEMCTMMYQLGDKCRQFAQCGVVGGSCQHIENPQFTACTACARACEKNFPNDPEKALNCESKCGE